MTREEMVVSYLQNYQEGCLELKRLEDLLACYPAESLDETIRALSQPQAMMEERVQDSALSNPTPRIAEIYKRVNAQHNQVGMMSLAREIEELRFGLNAIRLCVERLGERSRRVLSLLYFEGATWERVMEAEEFSRNTLQHHRTKGIKEIAQMAPFSQLKVG